jgi:PHD/YefM family antitoxin component YafN of YafNO toxin-antitoxin module
MGVKFSEDVVPLTDRPVVLTSRGRGVAAIQSVSDYEQAAEERAFMRAVVAGLADLDAGREVSLSGTRPNSVWDRDMGFAEISFTESALSDQHTSALFDLLTGLRQQRADKLFRTFQARPHSSLSATP